MSTTMMDMLARAEGYAADLERLLSAAYEVPFKTTKAHPNLRAYLEGIDNPTTADRRWGTSSVRTETMVEVSATVHGMLVFVRFHNHGKGHLYATPCINYGKCTPIHEKQKVLDVAALATLVREVVERYQQTNAAKAAEVRRREEGEAVLVKMDAHARANKVNRKPSVLYPYLKVEVAPHVADSFTFSANVSAAKLARLLAVMEED